MIKRTLGFVIALVFITSVEPLHAEQATRFRGANGNGTSSATRLPLTWSAGDHVVWKVPSPGYGAGSLVVLGDRIFLTGYTGYGTGESESTGPAELRSHVVCLDRSDGRVVWNRSFESNPNESRYLKYVAQHGYASGTPAVDKSGVYTFFGSTGVIAHDLDGKFLWKVSVGTKTHKFGSGASPILYEDLVIVNACVESNALVALDKKTGVEVWRTDGVNLTWNTPVLVDVGENIPELVLNVGGTLTGFNPRTGKKLWYFSSGIRDYICPSVVARDGKVYSVCGRGGSVIAVRAGGRGDVTESHQVWKSSGTSNVPSPVLEGNHLYFVSDKGIAHCLNAKTGKSVYKKRMPKSGNVYASVLAADRKLYAVTRENGTFVLAPGARFEQLAHNRLEGDDSIFNASPIVDNGQLLLRSDKFIYCIGK